MLCMGKSKLTTPFISAGGSNKARPSRIEVPAEKRRERDKESREQRVTHTIGGGDTAYREVWAGMCGLCPVIYSLISRQCLMSRFRNEKMSAQ